MSVSLERQFHQILQNNSIEEIEQEWAKRSLLAFTKYTFPQYEENWHHSYLCNKLDKVVSGEIKRLMIFMPPRFGKTELASRRLPAYILGKNPDYRVIATSYSADLASQNNRDVQRIMDSDLYQDLFPESYLSSSNVRTLAHGNYLRNSEIFEVINYDGFYKSAGVGGGITGRGFDFGIIDDPIKNAEEAHSPVYREKIYQWYISTFYTRREKDARIIIILTRWHEDDLAGRLLEQQKTGENTDEWDIVNFQAIKEKENEEDPREMGHPLWPEKYPKEELEIVRATIGSYMWNALYQQDPKNREGGMFRREWFEIIDQPPGGLKWVRYWDLAATEKKSHGRGPAFTAGVLMAEKEGVFYIADVKRIQANPAGVESLIKQTAQLDGATVRVFMEQEPGSSGKNTIDHYARRILIGYSFKGDRPTGDKATRAEPLSAAAENGNVRLVKGKWNRDFIDEAEGFPHGTYKDQIDAASGAFSKVNKRQLKTFKKSLLGL